MKSNYQIAVILKKEETEEVSNYIPVTIVEGVFDKDNNCFIDTFGNKFYHVIYNIGEYGFLNRVNLRDEMVKYPLLTPGLVKHIIFKSFMKYNFSLEVDETRDVPVIKYGLNDDMMSDFFDNDVMTYYNSFYRELYNSMVNDINSDTKLQDEFDINKSFNEISNVIVNQDVPLKQILSNISNHISNEGTSSILVNGKKGVGKDILINEIIKHLNIPYAVISLNSNQTVEYLGEKLTGVLDKLLMDSNTNFDIAERGILIINDFNKFTNFDYEDKKQEMLANFLSEEHYTTIDGVDYKFCANKLLVIAFGNWKSNNKIGFSLEDKEHKITREDLILNGMNSRLLDKFDNIIHLNDLSYDDYVKVLEKDDSLLNIKKKYMLEKGINLKYSEDILGVLVNSAIKKNRGIKGLNEIIEETLSYANFEINSNPLKYDELVITKDTVIDNKNYVLKKSLHK